MKIAAVVYAPGDAKAIDALFVALAAALKAEGWRVAGTIQHNRADASACAQMMLEDIVSGRVFDISVPAEKKHDACSLDPAALEDVAGHVAATLEGHPDLVLINRFGKQEALGNGLRSVVESAVGADLPVVTALCSAHLQAWEEFTGGADARLAAELGAVLSWCACAVKDPL